MHSQQQQDAQTINGARVGSWVRSPLLGGGPRRIVTGPDEDGMVELTADPPASPLSGGYFVHQDMIGAGRTFAPTDPPPQPEPSAPGLPE